MGCRVPSYSPEDALMWQLWRVTRMVDENGNIRTSPPALTKVCYGEYPTLTEALIAIDDYYWPEGSAVELVQCQ